MGIVDNEGDCGVAVDGRQGGQGKEFTGAGG